MPAPRESKSHQTSHLPGLLRILCRNVAPGLYRGRVSSLMSRLGPTRSCALSGKLVMPTTNDPITFELFRNHRAGPEEPVELSEIRLIGQGIPHRPLRPGASNRTQRKGVRRRSLGRSAAAAAPGLSDQSSAGSRRRFCVAATLERRGRDPASLRNTTPRASSPRRARRIGRSGQHRHHTLVV